MRWTAGLLVLGGCNAIFGLAPTQLGDDAGGTSDGGVPDAAAASADAYPPELTGTIGAISEKFVDSMGAQEAGFVIAASIGHPAQPCNTLIDVGDCTAFLCSAGTDPGPWPDAGTIEILGANAAALVPNTDGSYTTMYNSTTGLFAEGNPVTFSAPGAQVPMFMQVVTSPMGVDFQQSALPVGNAITTITRASGYDLTWTPVPSGTVLFGVVGSNGAVMRCFFPASRGSGRVEPQALLALPTGAGGAQAIVVENQVIQVGSYRLTFAASVCARNADGNWVNGSVDLQ